MKVYFYKICSTEIGNDACFLNKSVENLCAIRRRFKYNVRHNTEKKKYNKLYDYIRQNGSLQKWVVVPYTEKEFDNKSESENYYFNLLKELKPSLNLV
jgi:hypothetical protein